LPSAKKTAPTRFPKQNRILLTRQVAAEARHDVEAVAAARAHPVALPLEVVELEQLAEHEAPEQLQLSDGEVVDEVLGDQAERVLLVVDDGGAVGHVAERRVREQREALEGVRVAVELDGGGRLELEERKCKKR